MASNTKTIGNIISRPIEEILNSSFGRYAKYVIQDRALPDIRDGLKPVQRRILFAMNNLGITHDKPYKKSARSVGEVIGKYHPHGDSSIYEAMVRMSQEWKNNVPLLDMHGNKGSIDGDSAAAMRYTECRLSKIAEYMLENIEKKTVDFIPNFDDSEKEPAFLPSLIPNLFFNGSTGIAAGYATNIPPFNPKEIINGIIHRIDNPNCTIEKLASIIPGPDYPTAGIIQGKSGIIDAYKTGKGKHIIRAEIEENKLSKKINQLIIKSIPYETTKSSIIKSIDDLVFNEKISGIIEVRDESDKNGINIVIDVDADKSLETIKNFLYKNTQLQITYAINFIAIYNRKPVLLSLDKALDAFIEHTINILVKTLKFDLEKSEKRLEVLIGLIKAMSILDEVIRVIRKSTSKDDAKKNLISKFSFTEIQAEAIVTLRLYKLTSTDVTLVQKEHDELILKIKEIKDVLNSDELQKNMIKKILRGYRDEFGYERKTIIEDEIEKIVINDADLQESKEAIIMVTRDGYIKSTTRRSIDSSNYSDINIKPGDIVVDTIVTNTLNQVILITSNGQYVSIPCHKIKTTKYKDSFEHLNNFVKLDANEKIVYCFETNAALTVNKNLVICSKNGQIKQVDLNELTLSKSIKASNIMNLKDDDKVIYSQIIDKEASGQIVCVTKNGYGVRFEIDQVPVIGRTASGVKAQKTTEDDYVAGCSYVSNPDKQNILIVANRGLKRIKASDITLTKRAALGRSVLSQVKSNPANIITIINVNLEDTISICDNYAITNIKAKEVTLSGLETRISNFNDQKISAAFIDNWLTNQGESSQSSENEDSENKKTQKLVQEGLIKNED